MKKLINPQEQRRSKESSALDRLEEHLEEKDIFPFPAGAKLSKDLDGSEDFIDFQDFFKKALRHKKIIFFTFTILYSAFSFFYYHRGTWYELNASAITNNQKNSTFFKALDMSLDANDKDANEVDVNILLAQLKSDDFMNFCFDVALADSEVAKIFNLDLKKIRLSNYGEESRSRIRQFFRETALLSLLDNPASKKNYKTSFNILFTHQNRSFLEKAAPKVINIMIDYAAKVDSKEMLVAQKIIKDKIESIQKNTNEMNDQKFKTVQSMPIVDKSSVYTLQTQLQATKVAIIGNKALEAQFKERLSDVESKVGSIRGLSDAEGDPYALSKELESLSNQKNELKVQGIDKESFIYKNIANSLSKTLKSIEDNNVRSKVDQRKNTSSSSSLKISELSKSLDDLSSYIDKKMGSEGLLSDLEKPLTVNFSENNNSQVSKPKSSPVVNQEVISELKNQILSVKNFIEGDKFLEDRLGGRVGAIEKKLDMLTDAQSKLEKNYYSTTIQDISNMAYLQQQLKLQGVDDDSFVAKKVSGNLKKAVDELKKNKNIDFNKLKLMDLYPPSESTLYSQRESLEKIQNENYFYESKITELNKSLDELTFLLNDRTGKEAQIAVLEDAIKKNQTSMDFLNGSLAKMSIAEFKGQKKFSVFLDPIEERFLIPFSFFTLVSLLLSLIVGFFIAYFIDILNPDLSTAQAFEELGNFVLGGVPSTENPLFQSGTQADVFTNMAYLRMGIKLENILSPLRERVVLFCSSNNSLSSSVIALNLGFFLASSGRKVLVIESDLIKNSIAKITAAPLNGGLNEIFLNKEKFNINPYSISEGLDVLTGDSTQLPSLYLLPSKNFKDLLSKLSLQYDYIFLHTQPCLEAPDACDLSRFAELGIVCCDAEDMNIQKLQKLNQEMKEFLSKEKCFILENAKDIHVGRHFQPLAKKVAA